MRFLSLSFLLLICWSCDGDTAARKAARGPNFVADPNHLYFKNTRLRHYRAEEVTNRATILRHDALFASEARLLPVLIDNWLQDRAIIRFETRPPLSEWHLEVVRANDRRERLSLANPPTNESLDSLAAILLGKEELYLYSAADTASLAFPDGAGRAAARTVLLDYLRLVGY